MRTIRLIRSRNLGLTTALCLTAFSGAVGAAPFTYVDQGRSWKPADRRDFYTRDQGSRVIPLAWMRALKTSDGKPFLWDGLARYGYLPNPDNSAGLPIGFMAAGPAGRQDVGMNCSACHTRQIVVDGKEYRIDGGPALVDFQAFLTDLVNSVGRVLANDAAFAQFAAAVPGAGPGLKNDVSQWYLREHSLASRAFDDVNWGLGRLDAVGLIFDRVVGMDIGPPPTYLIESNIQPADAPNRYPFLWNAPKQDRTQWPGFAKNGSDTLALVRNLGQIYGVFGIVRPRNDNGRVDFLTGNATDWTGLERLEQLVKKIGAPKWPWTVNRPLAAQGKALYQANCSSCHAERMGPVRFPLNFTWATPLQDVGTDSRQYQILARTAKSGVLEGATPPFGKPIAPTATAFSLLGVTVIGTLVQHFTGVKIFEYGKDTPEATPAGPRLPSQATQELLSAYVPPPPAAQQDEGKFKYESRVMYGIWAAAPYLHNGSVPTLADLLKPGEDRPKRFKMGRRYDTALVGLARDQGDSPYEIETSCEDRDSGNSRCGHEFGTSLSDAEKRALLEYMKTL